MLCVISWNQSYFPVLSNIILTHLAHIANGKNRVLFCNNSQSGNVWRYLAPFYDVVHPINHVTLTLDGVTLILRVINVRNTCKHLRFN